MTVLTKYSNLPLPTNAVERIRWGDILIASLAALILSLVCFWMNPLSDHNPITQYSSMADKPFSFRELPYGGRLLTPLLAYCMPFGTDTEFRLIAFGSYFFTGLFLVLVMRLIDIPLYWAVALLPCFYFAPSARFIMANAWYTDPLNYWMMICVFFGALTRNLGVTLAAVTVGAFNRPESLFLVPVIAAAWWNVKYPVRSLLPVLWCCAPGILIFVSIWFVWPYVSDFLVIAIITGDPLGTSPVQIGKVFQKHGFSVLLSYEIWREIIPGAWGLAIIGILKGPRRITLFSLAHIGCSLLPMLIAVDFFRLPFFAFPGVLLLAGLGVSALNQRHPILAGAAVLVTWILLFFFPHGILAGIIAAFVLLLVYFLFPKTIARDTSIELDAAGDQFS